MQEQMRQLQQQLEVSQKVPTSSSTLRTAGSSAGPKPTTPKPTPALKPNSKVTQAKPAATIQKTKTQAGKKFGLQKWPLLLFYFTDKVQKQ